MQPLALLLAAVFALAAAPCEASDVLVPVNAPVENPADMPGANAEVPPAEVDVHEAVVDAPSENPALAGPDHALAARLPQSWVGALEVPPPEA